jgi:hypothetical protein
MMSKILHRGFCSRDMIITYDDPHLWNKAVASVAGERIQTTIEKEKKEKPLDPMRAYYFSVVVERFALVTCGVVTADSKESVHCGLKDKFLREYDEKLKMYRTLSISDKKKEVDNDKLFWYIRQCEIYGSEEYGFEWDERNSYEFKDEDEKR